MKHKRSKVLLLPPPLFQLVTAVEAVIPPITGYHSEWQYHHGGEIKPDNQTIFRTWKVPPLLSGPGGEAACLTQSMHIVAQVSQPFTRKKDALRLKSGMAYDDGPSLWVISSNITVTGSRGFWRAKFQVKRYLDTPKVHPTKKTARSGATT